MRYSVATALQRAERIDILAESREGSAALRQRDAASAKTASEGVLAAAHAYADRVVAAAERDAAAHLRKAAAMATALNVPEEQPS